MRPPQEDRGGRDDGQGERPEGEEEEEGELVCERPVVVRLKEAGQ